MRQSAEQRRFLWKATTAFRSQLHGSPGEEYLAHRGIDPERLPSLGLGYVGAEVPSGLEAYRGCLSVPYMRRGVTGEWSVAGIRFRCVRDACVKGDDGAFLEDEQHDGHGKMMSMPGDTHRLYNPVDVLDSTEEMSVVEGEPDTWTLKMCGVPSVGVGGVHGWKDHFTEAFRGFRRVWIFAQGDRPGREFADFVASRVPNGLIITMEPGTDVNQSYRRHGVQAILSKIGR
ncbi:topoisomerase [Streptomyces cacaoi]|uniref:Topoisomerase n=1 Tax=Streptomyces cacaoi TaxID=1898 RepID=A0A4Y3QYB9_STRCI|nr:topoisomerase [Streptomyces cacaoi]GEB50404.1 hypothetical protein SCA03_29550 [Streptomyces cacaoi]